MSSQSEQEVEMAAEVRGVDALLASTVPGPAMATPIMRQAIPVAQMPQQPPSDHRDDGRGPLAAIVVPIVVISLLLSVVAVVLFTVYKRRRFHEKRLSRFGDSEWMATENSNTKGAVPGLSLSAADAARGGDERHSLLPLTPMHRSLSEKSFRSAQSPNSDSRHPSLTPGDLNRSSLSGENTASRTSGIEVRRGSSERSCPSLYKDYDALQGVQAAEVQDTLFLDNDLYEGTHSACDDSDADGDYARPDDVRKGESEGEDIYEIQGDKEEQTDGEYEIPEDVRASRLEEDGDDIYEVPGNARTDDVQLPPRMPSPLSSDYTSSEGDVAQPQTRVEYYTAPMCSHCGQGCQQSCQGSKEHGYDPVYVPRHDADGMARRLDACNYYKPRSESTITSPYEEISTDTVYAVQEEVSSPAPVDDEDLDNDIPYATSEFIAYNNAMANNDSPELPPRNKSMIDLVIPPSPQSDSDPSTWQNTVPLRRPPPLVPRQRPQTTEANSRNSQPPPLLQPRAKSWAPKGRSDSVNSDYEPYDFSLARQQHQNA